MFLKSSGKLIGSVHRTRSHFFYLVDVFNEPTSLVYTSFGYKNRTVNMRSYIIISVNFI